MGDRQRGRYQKRDPEGSLKPERVQKRPAPAEGTLKPERVQREGLASPRGYEEPAAAPVQGVDAPATRKPRRPAGRRGG